MDKATLIQNQMNNQIRKKRNLLRERIILQKICYENKEKKLKLDIKLLFPPERTQNQVRVLNSFNWVDKQRIQGGFEDQYDLLQKIGQGTHVAVYRCIEKPTGKVYVVKITKHGDQQSIQTSKVQFKILKHLDHQSVMKAYSFYTDATKMTTYLVCQLCSYPELGNYLREKATKLLSETQATSIIIQLLQTLEYLHKNGVCLRDIKPQNILYNPLTKKIKVIDFDCAKSMKQSELKFEMWTKLGSLHYQAPQYFQKTAYNEKVDIWAVGVLAYQLVTGNLPFKSNYYKQMIEKIINQDIHVDQLHISQDFKDLLKKLLQRNSFKRYTASECLRMPIILKAQHSYIAIVSDDFEIQLRNSCANHTSNEPNYLPKSKSCSDLFKEKNKQIPLIPDKILKQAILKYYFFEIQI